MLSNEGSVGSCHDSDAKKRQLAKESKDFNLSNIDFVAVFSPFFDVLYKEEKVQHVSISKKALVWHKIKQNAVHVAIGLAVLGIFLIKNK